MLPARNRLRAPADFTRATRHGVRAGTSVLVVHYAPEPTGETAASNPPRIGFVVSRAVGNAVTRNRVQRRLRHLSRDFLGAVPAGGVVVVRALPPAATATSEELRVALDRCLSRVQQRAGSSR